MREEIIMLADKCKACRRCEVACIAAHHGMDQKEAMKHRNELASRVKIIKDDNIKTGVRCRNCQPAPCANICPMGALKQDKKGHITLHEELCIGCGMCVEACPYGAANLEEQTNNIGDSTTTRTVCSISFEEAASGMKCLHLEEHHRCTRFVNVHCDLCEEWRKEQGTPFTACQLSCGFGAIGLMTEEGKIIFPEIKKKPKPAAKPAAAKPADAPAEAKPEA